MSRARSSARRRLARAARWLAVIVIAGAATATTGAAQARAAAPAAAARAAARTPITPQPITLDPGWSGSAGYNSRGPAWYSDSSGLIHLEGAVGQPNPNGTTPNLIGTLPAPPRRPATCTRSCIPSRAPTPTWTSRAAAGSS